MNNIPYIYSNDGNVETLIITLSGVPNVVDSSHQSFKEIKDGLNTLSVKEIRELLDIKKAVAKQLKRFGNITVSEDGVSYKGEAVHGLLADRMMQMLENGYNIAPWALFMENLQQNPAKHAVDELYLWLERSNMPITERGNFLAYKKVKEDYTSFHNNADGTKFHNDIGTLCSMPRNKVDDNRNKTCSSGLHFCSWDYLPAYYGSSGKVVLVEVNPAHVVSIPSDYNNAKGRAEAYLVVGEIPQDECEHAFFNIPSVDFHSSSYITYDNDDPIDYSSIEDDWYDDYDCDDHDMDQWYEDSYEIGFEEGKRDALAFKSSDWEDGYYDEYDEGNFSDGYHDGFWEYERQMQEEEDEYEMSLLVKAPDFVDTPDFENMTFADASLEMCGNTVNQDSDEGAEYRGFLSGYTDKMNRISAPVQSTVNDGTEFWNSYITGYLNGNA